MTRLPNDRPDKRRAAETTVVIGHLQHSQDIRLTTDEQRKLTAARGVLTDLVARIEKGIEL